jgi:hypothetical protein
MKRGKIGTVLAVGLAGLLCGISSAEGAPRTAEQSAVVLEKLDPSAQGVPVLLIAGSVSNKVGQHEYFAGCTLLANWLRQNSGVVPVQAAEGWPADESLVDRAKVIVVFADGGGKLPFLDASRMERVRAAMKRGAGLVLLHQAVDVPASVKDEVGSWMGGVWQPDIGSRGHWDMDFSSFPKHPVTRGVQPFSAPLDGWLYNLHFHKDAVPLVSGAVPDKSRSTPDAKAHVGRSEVIGWAYERPGGGRSFGFTGCDLHRNWGVESQRRLVVNGILWAAGLEVPEAGAKVENPAADLLRWMDDKSKEAKAK